MRLNCPYTNNCMYGTFVRTATRMDNANNNIHLPLSTTTAPHTHAHHPRSHMCSANTVTIACMVALSHLTLQLPSVFVSQKHVLAVCRPAPFFCMMMQVTTYLNGLLAACSDLSTDSTMADVQSCTRLAVYNCLPNTGSRD